MIEIHIEQLKKKITYSPPLGVIVYNKTDTFYKTHVRILQNFTAEIGVHAFYDSNLG